MRIAMWGDGTGQRAIRSIVGEGPPSPAHAARVVRGTQDDACGLMQSNTGYHVSGAVRTGMLLLLMLLLERVAENCRLFVIFVRKNINEIRNVTGIFKNTNILYFHLLFIVCLFSI